jgi:hypothetical protein
MQVYSNPRGLVLNLNEGTVSVVDHLQTTGVRLKKVVMKQSLQLGAYARRLCRRHCHPQKRAAARNAVAEEQPAEGVEVASPVGFEPMIH